MAQFDYSNKLTLTRLWGKVKELVSTKVDKVPGQGLSTVDYTVADADKLASLAGVKSIGAGLALSGDGELSATGGSGGANQHITVDDSLDETSLNPVQNRVLLGVFESQRAVMEYMQGKITANETAIGEVSDLTTTDKTSLVKAVNEIHATAAQADQLLGQEITAIQNAGYQTAAQVEAGLAVKQDALVSGINIKTVGGQSLLGAGDITLANADMQTEGDWRYKINPDNTFEAYYYKSGVTLTITDQSGNFFRSALQTLALPAGIANNYAATPLHASVNAAHNNYPCFGTLASMATNQVKYYAMSGSSRGQSPNYIVTAHVFGILAANA